MDKTIFRQNLLEATNEIVLTQKINSIPFMYTIETVKEERKTRNSKDEYMRLCILNHIKGGPLDIDEVVNILTLLTPLVPIWIDVSLCGINDNMALMKLKCSSRFRKPSLLRNQETGHPPFKAVSKYTEIGS